MSNPELEAEQVERLRALLEEMRSQLDTQLNQARDTSKPVELDQQSVGRVSRIDAIQQQQMALAGREQVQRTLRSIALALSRIDRGAYGYCRSCEEPIAFARLQAQPFADLCVDCQAASED